MEFTARELAEHILRLPEKEQHYLVRFPFTLPTGDTVLFPVEKIEVNATRSALVLT